MPNLDRPISEFPRALEVLASALVLISNPSGIDSYDSYSCTLTELGKTILDVEYTQELGQVSVFEAIINLRVLSGTGDPSSSLGVDNQIYVKYQTVGGVDSVTALYIKLNGAWVEIQTGGGGGASVTLGTTVPSDASGSDGDLYVQYDGTTYAVIEYYVKINGSWRKAPYSRVVALTQAEYDLITPDPTTLYIITDAQNSYVQLPVITDAYDATSTYDVGDLCIHNDALYKCTTAITVAEAWTPAHWTQTSIADELTGKQNILTPISKTITPRTGTTIDGVSFYKYGNIVNLIMRVEVSSPTSWANIADIPSDCCPSVEVFGVMDNTSTTTGVTMAHIAVYPNGTVKLANVLPDSGKKYNCSLTWIVT